MKKLFFLFCKLTKNQGFIKPEFSLRKLVKFFFIQKILRFNTKVSWPVHWSSTIVMPANIHPGSRCPGFSKWCHIDGRNGINIGTNTWIGPGVKIISMNHNINNYHQYIQTEPITIGDNCWLGADCIILPGVKLGNHTIVAAGAVVVKSFPEEDQIIAGNPARVVKKTTVYQQS